MLVVKKSHKFVFIVTIVLLMSLIWLVLTGLAADKVFDLDAKPSSTLSLSSTSSGPDQFVSPAAPDSVLVGFNTNNEHIAQFEPDAFSHLLTKIPMTSLEPLFIDSANLTVAASVNSKPAYTTLYRMQLEPGADVTAVIQTLNNDPTVAFAEPDYLAHLITTPNDPLYTGQWGLSQIQAPAAWDVTNGSSDVVIAVIDSGIDVNHPDLAGQLWTNPGEIAGNNIDDDNNGYTDDVHGWNMVDDNADLSDNTGHGTEVAGIIAATSNNNTGIAGLCWQCRLMIIKVTQSGGVANYSDIAAGIHYAAQKGADVINLSLGAYSDSTTLKTVLAEAAETAVIIGGSGNDSVNTPFYPAAYNDYVLAVAGTTSSDTKVSTSNYGTWVDVAAPGEVIMTTFDGDTYGTSSGTSMAAPFAAGLAGLLRSYHPDWSADSIRAQIAQTTDNIDSLNSGYENQLGSGRLNAQKSLTTAAVPIIVYAEHSVDGVENGRPEPGSTVDVDIALVNDWADAKNVQATLSSTDPYVTIVSGTAVYDSIPTYASVTNQSSFRITVSGSAPYAQDLALTLNVTADGGYVTAVPITITTASGIEYVNSNIVANTTWNNDKIYVVKKDLGIASGAVLTIEAGTEVRFDGYYKLQVAGTLIAVGTEDNPILFTSNQSNPSKRDWSGISFTDTSQDAVVDGDGEYISGSILKHTIIEYAENAIDIHLASPYLSNNYIWQNSYGIWGEFGSPYIVENVIEQNEHWGIYVRSNGSTTIIRNRIMDNGQGVYVGYFSNGSLQVKNNLVANNTGLGIQRAIFHNNSQFMYNTVVDNGGTGFQSDSGSLNVTVQNNNILRNSPYNASLYYDSVDADTMNITAAQNYWGTTNTALIDQNIYDFSDDINVGIIQYSPILNEPDPDAPAFIKSLTISPANPIGIETAAVEIAFSRPMDESQNPVVMFGNSAPYTTYQILDNAQWLDESHWQATFDVTSLLPRDSYTIRVSDAYGTDGMAIAPDTRFSFTVDYAGEITDQTPPEPPSIIAGGVEGNASAAMAIWSANDPNSPITGYRYAIGSAPGATDIVNWTAVSGTTFSRSGLGLVEGQQYWVAVQARNNGGLWSASSYSAFVSGQPMSQNFLPVIAKQ